MYVYLHTYNGMFDYLEVLQISINTKKPAKFLNILYLNYVHYKGESTVFKY